MTKTKTQAELHRSRELQRAWLVHSASELRNRLLTPAPWDAHHHSEAKCPTPPHQQTHTFKGAPWQQRFVLPHNVVESWEKKKRLNAQGEACLHLSHKSTSMYFCSLLWECITTVVDNINTRVLFVRTRWGRWQAQLILWGCFVYIKTFKLKL